MVFRCPRTPVSFIHSVINLHQWIALARDSRDAVLYIVDSDSQNEGPNLYIFPHADTPTQPESAHLWSPLPPCLPSFLFSAFTGSWWIPRHIGWTLCPWPPLDTSLLWVALLKHLSEVCPEHLIAVGSLSPILSADIPVSFTCVAFYVALPAFRHSACYL